MGEPLGESEELIALPTGPRPPGEAWAWIDPAEILESISEAFYALDGEWRFVYINRWAEKLWGRSRRELLGQVATEAFPRWSGSESYRAHQEVMRSGKPLRIQTLSTVMGTPIELNVFPRGDGLSVYFRDLSESARMEQALRERSELLRLAETSAGVGVWDMDMQSQTVRATPEFFRIVGLPASEEPVPIETLRALRHPDDRAHVVEKFQQVLQSGQDQYEAEYRIVRPDGKVRWVFGRGRIFRDKDGKPVRYTGVDIDITERKKFEEHLAFTTRELSHRTKNILAVVQAIVHQIGRRSRNFTDFEKRMHGCIAALAHCHDLLVASDWQGAELRTLVETQVAPFCGTDDRRIRIEGPSLLLMPQAAQVVGLALHELGTNAVKHGALSAPDGSVTVDWKQDSAGADLQLTWRERNGKPVKPPTSTGFGHVVLQRMASTIDENVSLQFPPEGAVWTLRLDPKHIAA